MTRRWACVVILLLLAVPVAWADEGLETGMAIQQNGRTMRDDGITIPIPAASSLAAEAMPT